MFLEMILIIILSLVWLKIGRKQRKQVKVVILGFIFGLAFDLSRYLNEYAIIIGGVIITILAIAGKE